MGAVSGARLWAVLALSLTSACNPFAGFGDCASREIELKDVDVDVDAATERALGKHTGTLTWTRPGRSTSLFVEVARSEAEPAYGDSNCDGELEEIVVPLRITVESDDGLVATEQKHYLSLDLAGAFKSLSPPATGGAVSFDELKAQGITPADWVSNFSPVLSLPLSEPDLRPQAGAVTADIGGPSARMTVVLGEVTFP